MKSAKEPNLNKRITLRPCFQEDSEFYYQVKKITLIEHIESLWGPWNEQDQRERHRRSFDPANTQIIQFQGKDTGILAIQEEPDVLHISNIEILPEYQNKGIGTYVLSNLMHEARQKKKRVSLQVLKPNLRAKQLYQRLGFKIVSQNDSHFQMIVQ